MFRRIAPLITLSMLLGSHASADSAGSSLAPVYEGTHVLPTMRQSAIPSKPEWSEGFMHDTGIVLRKHGWYLAEVACLLDESGQVRDAILTEAIPSLNLSATIVKELRYKKWIAALGPSGAVPSRFYFRMVYKVQNQKKSLSQIGHRLRREADNGKASSQYLLSRLMNAEVGFKKSDLEEDTLLRKAAEGGDRRAMLAMALDTSLVPGTNPAAITAERRGWLLKSAQAGSGPASVLVALDAWAERTTEGRSRARQWLERAHASKDPVAAKYLAALLVSHPTSAADGRTARELALTATDSWHSRGDADAWQVLAAASAAVNDFRAAVDAQNKAIDLAKTASWQLGPLETRLSAYQASRAVTDEIVVIPAIAHLVMPGPKLNAE